MQKGGGNGKKGGGNVIGCEVSVMSCRLQVAPFSSYKAPYFKNLYMASVSPLTFRCRNVEKYCQVSHL